MGFKPFCLGFACSLAMIAFLGNADPALADTAMVVRPGDTLISIATRHRVTVDSIVRLNGLPSAERIFVGQHLRIPTDQQAPPLTSASQSASFNGDRGRPSAPTRLASESSVRSASAAVASAPLASAPVAAAQAPAAAQFPASSGAMSGVHVVGAGENLFRIALGYGTTAAQLAQANGLPSVDRIFVGQRLRVPGSGGIGGGQGAAAPSIAPVTSAARSIIIDLSDQRLYAYQGDVVVQAFVVSTGSPQTPTPVGSFRVYNRLVSQDMYGPGYYAPGVPWVQYFTGAYAMHGTYWHDNFGVPVSHGCINMRTPDAAWLFDWAQQGTLVRVQY